MIGLKKVIEQGFTGKPGGLYDVLKQLQNGVAGIGGQVFFVEGNAGNDSYNKGAGLSWDRAYKNVAFAIARSNEQISASREGYGMGWAARNTIFIRGDFTETLTVAPSKTDIIGVGSTNARPRPRITGSQVMEDTAWGSRFINIEFRGDAAAETMVWTAGGFEIHDCVFSHADAYAGTHAITILNPSDVIIKGCDFEMRNEAFFSTAAIAVSSNGVVNRFRVLNSRIRGAVGIHLGVSGDDNFYDCSIEDCDIYASGLPVYDDTMAQRVLLLNNRLITQGAEDLTGMNDKYAAGNIYTSTSDTRTFPFATVSG